MSSRVVITGCGWVCPHAAGGWSDVTARLAAAQSTVKNISHAFVRVPDDLLRTVAVTEECQRDRLTWLAAVALVHARASAQSTIEQSGGLEASGESESSPVPAERIGLC